MSGTVNISRGLFDSEAFRDEVLTEREAWVWMVMAASWKARPVRSGDYVANTERGQLAHSIRYMAKAWKWTPAKAQRYLKRLEKLKMICVETDTGVSVVTVCKYDEYQNGGKATDTDPIQDRYRTDTEKKKDERREEGKQKDAQPDGFAEFWAIWPVKVSKQRAKTAWRKLSVENRRAAYRAVRDGWFERWRQSKPDANPIHPSTFINDKRWTDEFTPNLKAIPGGHNGQPTNNANDRVQRIVTAAARGTSGQDWG